MHSASDVTGHIHTPAFVGLSCKCKKSACITELQLVSIGHVSPQLRILRWEPPSARNGTWACRTVRITMTWRKTQNRQQSADRTETCLRVYRPIYVTHKGRGSERSLFYSTSTRPTAQSGYAAFSALQNWRFLVATVTDRTGPVREYSPSVSEESV